MGVNGYEVLDMECHPLEVQRDQLLTQRDRLIDELTPFNVTLTAKKAKWANVHVDHFSIDLVKKGTSEPNVALPENRLPLFRVIPN